MLAGGEGALSGASAPQLVGSRHATGMMNSGLSLFFYYTPQRSRDTVLGVSEWGGRGPQEQSQLCACLFGPFQTQIKLSSMVTTSSADLFSLDHLWIT